MATSAGFSIATSPPEAISAASSPTKAGRTNNARKPPTAAQLLEQIRQLEAEGHKLRSEAAGPGKSCLYFCWWNMIRLVSVLKISSWKIYLFTWVLRMLISYEGTWCKFYLSTLSMSVWQFKNANWRISSLIFSAFLW